MKQSSLVVSRVAVASGEARVEVDEWVPLRFRTYPGVLSVKHLTVGNRMDSLLEFLLDPDSLAVRGFSLTSINATHKPKTICIESVERGLPVIDFDRKFEGLIDVQRIDLQQDFSVALGEDFAEIDLGGVDGAQRVIRAGAAEFYLDAGRLVGIRVGGLTAAQRSTLSVHLSEAATRHRGP